MGAFKPCVYVRVRECVWWEMQALMGDESHCMHSCMYIFFSACVRDSYQRVCVCALLLLHTHTLLCMKCYSSVQLCHFSSSLIDLADPPV